MGSQVKIGDRIFNALGRGRLSQAAPAEKQIRYSTMGGAAALTSLNGTALVTSLIPIVPGSNLIVIKNIICSIEFVDAGVANYNVSQLAKVYMEQANYANLDTGGVFVPYLGNQAQGNLYDILATVTTPTSTVSINCSIYGGDVNRLTGVTPGAADSVVTQITLVYEPL